MTARLGRILAAALLSVSLPPSAGSRLNAQRVESTSPVVYTAEVDSVIQPVSADYMIATIDRADADRAALVVFTLRTPGGLVDSTRSIVTRMLAAQTPERAPRPPDSS